MRELPLPLEQNRKSIVRLFTSESLIFICVPISGKIRPQVMWNVVLWNSGFQNIVRDRTQQGRLSLKKSGKLGGMGRLFHECDLTREMAKMLVVVG